MIVDVHGPVKKFARTDFLRLARGDRAVASTGSQATREGGTQARRARRRAEETGGESGKVGGRDWWSDPKRGVALPTPHHSPAAARDSARRQPLSPPPSACRCRGQSCSHTLIQVSWHTADCASPLASCSQLSPLMQQAAGSAAATASTAAAAAAALAAAATPATAAPQEDAGRFISTVRQIASLSSISQLGAHAERWRQKEGTVRSPLVLLQVLALSRQFACMQAPPSTPAKMKAYGRGLKAHGQPDAVTAGRPLRPSDLRHAAALSSPLACLGSHSLPAYACA